VSGQAWAVAAIGLLAALYLAARFVRRRGVSTCCGERECPAAREALRRMGPGRP
jgi:hypothetical protein